MAIVWLLLLALTQSSIACQRDLHLRDDIEHKQDLPLIPRQLEPFPPQWSPNEKILHTSISTASIEAWSSYYTHGDHIAGRNKSMAEETAKQWTAHGVPSSLVQYEVFLNYPKEQALLLKRGNASIHQAQLYEDVLEEDETTGYAGAPPGFHGYSASGKVEAEYVYVGYVVFLLCLRYVQLL
jgi:N-acetylated-alpha-linked acidic dipeptidase